MFKKLDFPNRITIEVTNRCNVSCSFCPRQTVDMDLGDMDFELYRKIIDEASEHLPVKLVIFFRGEPLLYDKLGDAIRYAKNKGIGPIQFTSNAMALDNEKADLLISTNVDFVSFSLDTLDRQLYKKSRMFGDLDISMNNVINFSEKCKKKRKEGLEAPVIQVSTIEVKEYLDGEKDFIDFWLKYADIVRVYYEHDDKGKFADPELEKQLLPNIERQPCRKIYTDFLIYWDGTVALCNYDWNEKQITMNVRNHSISEIWNSKDFEKIREMHEHNNFEDSIICKECQHWKIDYMPDGFLGKIYKANERSRIEANMSQCDI